MLDGGTRIGSMPITVCPWFDLRTAGSSVLASFAVETMIAQAPEFSMMWVWSRSVLVT